MSVMNFFILTNAERTEAMTFNTPEVAINPRAVDNGSPGVGLNLNDNPSCAYASGEPVTLTDKYVAPKRIVDDPDYQQYAPDMITYLLTMPWASLETETIFLPQED